MPSKVYLWSGPVPREAAGRAVRGALNELGDLKGKTFNVVVATAGSGRFLRGPGVYTLEELLVAAKNSGASRIRVLVMGSSVADTAILGYLRYGHLNLAEVSLYRRRPRGRVAFAFLPHYSSGLRLGRDLVPEGLRAHLYFADVWSVPVYENGKIKEEVRVGLEAASSDLEALDSVLEYLLLSSAKAPHVEVVGEDPSLWRTPIE